MLLAASIARRRAGLLCTDPEILAYIRFPSYLRRPREKPQRQAFHLSSSFRDHGNQTCGSHQLLSKYKEYLTFPSATHDIETLEKGRIPKEQIVLHGYLGARADLSKRLYFVPLLSKDLSHSIQIVSIASSTAGRALVAHESLKQYGPGTPVAVTGFVKARNAAASKDPGDVTKVKTHELVLHDVQALNEMPRDVLMTPETIFPPEQRHLQIRKEKSLRDALAFRSEAAALCRNTLRDDLGFIEVETPLLFKSTPEGAREFIVPTRRKGLAYALPQSPQQFKQILMSSGIPRYFQIAKCFRDEDLRADRQPEFTQLDLEMSFASGEDVMYCIERLIKVLWDKLLNTKLPEQVPRMTYGDAMAKFGSDKPDTRLGMHLSRIEYLLPADLISMISPLKGPVVEIMSLRLDAMDSDPTETRKFVSGFLDSPDAAVFHENPAGGPGVFVFDSGKPLQGLQSFGFGAAEEVERLLDLEHGDLIVLQARKDGPWSGGSTALGNLRLALHRAAVKQGLVKAPRGFEPLWIIDFPLFSPTSDSEPGQGGAAGLASTHHPFTSPKSVEDVDLLLTDPTKAVGDHYDLVMNGVELGGGSRRIHSAEMQEFVMENVLKMSPERVLEFSHLLEVLRAGCPPHAGIALGFDRLVAVMLGKESVRDVIAFPKSGKGEDLLVKSPGPLSEQTLRTYHLRLRNG